MGWDDSISKLWVLLLHYATHLDSWNTLEPFFVLPKFVHKQGLHSKAGLKFLYFKLVYILATSLILAFTFDIVSLMFEQPASVAYFDIKTWHNELHPSLCIHHPIKSHRGQLQNELTNRKFACRACPNEITLMNQNACRTQCGSVTTRLIFSHILIIDTPQLASEGEVWMSVVRLILFTFYYCHRCIACYVLINSTAS